MPARDTTPILIAGPTASGKSALAMRLAKHVDGCIINADSMQVYGVLRALTARPDAEEEAQAPHRLYGHIDPSADYSVGQWQSEALQAMETAQQAGQRPIVVGGTGLYFKSLTEGLTDIPDIDPQLRSFWRARLAAEGAAALHAELATVDEDLAARLEKNDGQRISRGLEVFHATGTPLSHWQAVKPVPPVSAAHKILLMPARDWLYARCDARFEQMMTQSALDEVRALREMQLAADRPVMKALGVAEIMAFLDEAHDRDTAIAMAQQATRRYAKRQMTWFRNQMTQWQSFSEQEYNQEYDKIFSFISKNSLTAT